ncbi:hypothetical protein ACJMK2_029380 [Sinanodonta woodiana]|uniref:Uncharacterized protein n=1 Tax=Sinanodonta woodiana TaxID=1069815 RepID=A0ABD3XDM2_SINWO
MATEHRRDPLRTVELSKRWLNQQARGNEKDTVVSTLVNRIHLHHLHHKAHTLPPKHTNPWHNISPVKPAATVEQDTRIENIQANDPMTEIVRI